MWDLSSLTRNQTCVPCIKGRMLNPETPGKPHQCLDMWKLSLFTCGLHVLLGWLPQVMLLFITASCCLPILASLSQSRIKKEARVVFNSRNDVGLSAASLNLLLQAHRSVLVTDLCSLQLDEEIEKWVTKPVLAIFVVWEWDSGRSVPVNLRLT